MLPSCLFASAAIGGFTLLMFELMSPSPLLICVRRTRSRLKRGLKAVVQNFPTFLPFLFSSWDAGGGVDAYMLSYHS
jgi:hypothetical protein